MRHHGARPLHDVGILGAAMNHQEIAHAAKGCQRERDATLQPIDNLAHLVLLRALVRLSGGPVVLAAAEEAQSADTEAKEADRQGRHVGGP
jgi:hypothetical protein